MERGSNYSANKIELKSIRKRLRNQSTSAESALWKMLKNKQLNGLKFRRQHSIDNYIVDFYCSSEKLIIELDGYYHGDYIQIRKDTERDKKLEEKGYRVLRFENRFVFQDPDYVKDTILEELKRK